MPVHVELRCHGPGAPSNGCPEGEAGVLRADEERDNHDGVRDAVSGLIRRAEAAGWARNKNDARYRCPACARGMEAGEPIAGYPRAVWERALDRYCAGEGPAVWGGQDGLPTKTQFNNAVARYPWMRERQRAAPRWKVDRKERSSPLPEERWPLVLARFLAGEAKEDICTDERHLWPSLKMWNGKMSRDAEHARRRQFIADSIDWERALQRFLNGEPLYVICSEPRMPNHNRWHQRLRQDEAFRKIVYDHYFWVGSGKATLTLGDAPYERALQLVREGFQLQEAFAQPGTPRQQSFHRRVQRDPAFKREYEGALAVSGRESRRARLDPQSGQRWIDAQADWIGAVQALREGRHLDEVVGTMPIEGGPSAKQWGHRLRTDEEFARIVSRAYAAGKPLRLERQDVRPCTLESLREAIGYVREGLGPREAAVKAGIHPQLFTRRVREDNLARPLYEAAIRAYQDQRRRERQEVMERQKAATAERNETRKREAERVRHQNSVPTGERFRRQLMQNEVFAAVSKALPRHLPPHIRDDVLSDMVLAVLEGELPFADIEWSARKYLTRHHREAGTYQTISMDSAIRGTDDLKLIDTFSTEDAMWAH